MIIALEDAKYKLIGMKDQIAELGSALRIEQLRTDSLYLFGSSHPFWYLKISFLVGLVCFLLFGGILLHHAIRGVRKPTAFDE